MCALQLLQWPRFFSGKLLSVDDLTMEQEYVREKLKRHNRSLHGFGIVEGLKTTLDAGRVVIDKGLALDCEGNELLVESPKLVSLPAGKAASTIYIQVRYVEESAGTVTVGGAEEVAVLREGVEICTTHVNSNAGHRHQRARWLSCGQSHALTIARLRPGSRGWRLDARYRAPSIK